MKKTSVRTALGVALVWIIITLIAFLAGYGASFFAFGILLNIFLLLTTISLGLFLTKKENGFAEGIFLEDFKTAMQGGLVYAIVISAFVYCYHDFIDPSIKVNLRESYMDAIRAQVPDQEAFKTEIQDKNPEWKNKTYDDYMENQEITTGAFISSTSVFIFHLMGLFIFAMFFSFFGTIIVRKVILRQ